MPLSHSFYSDTQQGFQVKRKTKPRILWDDEAEEAFEVCKKKLSEVSLLAFADEETDLTLVTHASGIAMEQQLSS